MNRALATASVLATWLAAGAAGAQPAKTPAEPTPPPGSTRSTCTQGERGAISEVACELAHGLDSVPQGARVVATPVKTDAKLKSPERLGALVARVVAGQLGGGAQAHAEPAGLARARTLASSAGTLVHLTVELARGELRVTADVYPVPRSFWDRVRDPRPSPSAHAFATRRLDPELRTFLPKVPLVAHRVEKAKSPERSPVAIGCGDLDRDGSLELVLVGRRKIRIGRIRSQAFVTHAAASWTQLSPVAQSPLREPLASVAIAPGRHVDIGLSDRAQMLRFSPELKLLGSIGRRIPWPTGGCSRFQGVSMLPQLVPCQPGDPEPNPSSFGHPTDALAGARLLTPTGEARVVLGGRLASGPAAVLRDGAGQTARVDGVGAQLAVGDVDGDGLPELLSGANTRAPDGDALIVHTWLADGSVKERYRLAVPTGVHALAICPPESSGAATIAVATRGQIWIVR